MIYCPYCQPGDAGKGWVAMACVDCTERLMEESMAKPDPANDPRLADPNDPLAKLLKPSEVDP